MVLKQKLFWLKNFHIASDIGTRATLNNTNWQNALYIMFCKLFCETSTGILYLCCSQGKPGNLSKNSRQNLLNEAFCHLVSRFPLGFLSPAGGVEVAGARVRTLLETIKVKLNCPNWFPQRGAMTDSDPMQERRQDWRGLYGHRCLGQHVNFS